MSTLNIETLEGFKINTLLSSEGVMISLVPERPLLDDGAIDVFQISLNKNSVKNLLESLKQKNTFITRRNDFKSFFIDEKLKWEFLFIHLGNKYLRCSIPEKYISEIINSIQTNNKNADILDKKNEPCPCGSGKKFRKCCMHKFLKQESGNFDNLLKKISQIKDEMIFHLIQTAKENPFCLNDFNYWLDLGTYLGINNYHELAIECFTEVLNIDPENTAAKVNMAVSLNAKGNTDKALELLREVPEGNSRKNVIEANIRQQLGEHEKAIDLYEKAIEEEPDFYLPYARILNSLKELNSPLLDYWLEKGIKAVPESPWIARSYCLNLFDKGKFEELYEADWLDNIKSQFGRQDIIDDENDLDLIIEVKLFRSFIKAIKEKNKEELKNGISLLETSKNLGNLCTVAKGLVTASQILGEAEFALSAYNQVCPDCATLGENYEAKIKSNAYFNACNFSGCVENCECILEREENNKEALYFYWWSLDELGEIDKAIEIAEKYNKLFPDTESIYYNLALMCGKSGFWGKSKNYYEIELKKNPQNHFALENAIVIDLAEKNFQAANEKWKNFENIIIEDLANSETEAREHYEFLLNLKRDKFNKLVDFCNSILDKHSYSLDLIEFNQSHSPILGGYLEIREDKFSIEALLKFAMAKNDLSFNQEALFQSQMEQRSDFSAIIKKLRKTFHSWDNFLKESQSSIIEGEKGLENTGRVDYSSVIVLFSKAIEIMLLKKVFFQFRNKLTFTKESLNNFNNILTDKDHKLNRFASFIDNTISNLELGTMVHMLKFCKKDEFKSNPLINEFIIFLVNGKFNKILEKKNINLLFKITDYRNPAAHSQVYSIDEAMQVKELTIEIFNQVFL